MSEIALAVLLLAGAGLLIRSFTRLASVDPGFRVEQALTFELTLPDARYEKEQLPAGAAGDEDRPGRGFTG